jgi:hypothetical protein
LKNLLIELFDELPVFILKVLDDFSQINILCVQPITFKALPFGLIDHVTKLDHLLLKLIAGLIVPALEVIDLSP